MPSIGEVLAIQLEKLRKKEGLTQQELADKLGVTRQSIARYESGKGGATLDTIARLAKIFQVEETDLVQTEKLTEKIEVSGPIVEAFKNAIAQQAIKNDRISIVNRPSLQEQIIPKRIQEKLAKLDPIERETLLEMLESNADSFLLDKSDSDSDAG